jgi:hypothetical protein
MTLRTTTHDLWPKGVYELPVDDFEAIARAPQAVGGSAISADIHRHALNHNIL